MIVFFAPLLLEEYNESSPPFSLEGAKVGTNKTWIFSDNQTLIPNSAHHVQKQILTIFFFRREKQQNTPADTCAGAGTSN